MKVVVTGGGSGGHITPILAVAHELKRLRPDTEIIYIGQTGDPFADIPRRSPVIDTVYTVSAGKFRRYYGAGIRQIFDVRTMALNIRDALRIMRGLLESRRLIRRLQPAVVFSRGGYVSVPVALGARANGVPYITHDSDAIPSLANRLIAGHAARNAVALPAELYPYDQAKTVTVGVPVRTEYLPVTPEMKLAYRRELVIDATAPMVFVIGGGLGATRINDALLAVVRQLFIDNPGLVLVHQAGQANEAAVQAAYAASLPPEQYQRVKVFGYMDDVYRYGGAADLVITRAGASSIADFAVQGKACIIVPSPFLTGGHQLKNARFLQEQRAAEVLDEHQLIERPQLLRELITQLLSDPQRREQLGTALRAFGHRDSATELAQLVFTIGDGKR